MLKKLLLFFFVLQYTSAFAQVPFAQVSQAPLLVNPSLAGSKEKQRISVAFNRYGPIKEKYANWYGSDKYANAYVSYDRMLKKLGTGIGVYYSYNALDQDTSQSWERWLYKSNATRFGSSSKRHTGGVAIAPKYNIYSKKEPTKIAYSFSPSLGLEYSHLNFSRNYNYQTYYSNDYDTSTPWGSRHMDSAGYYLSTLSANTFRVSIGLQFNSDKTVVLYRASYGVDLIHEKEGLTISIPSQHSVDNQSYKYPLYFIDQSLNVGRTFTLKQGTYALTCLGGIGYKHYLSPLPSYQAYDVNFIGGKATAINYKHLSAILKISRLLLGAAYTQSFNITYSGITIGYQSETIKITSTWNVTDQKSILFMFSEVTASYLF